MNSKQKSAYLFLLRRLSTGEGLEYFYSKIKLGKPSLQSAMVCLVYSATLSRASCRTQHRAATETRFCRLSAASAASLIERRSTFRSKRRSTATQLAHSRQYSAMCPLCCAPIFVCSKVSAARSSSARRAKSAPSAAAILCAKARRRLCGCSLATGEIFRSHSRAMRRVKKEKCSQNLALWSVDVCIAGPQLLSSRCVAFETASLPPFSTCIISIAHRWLSPFRLIHSFCLDCCFLGVFSINASSSTFRSCTCSKP